MARLSFLCSSCYWCIITSSLVFDVDCSASRSRLTELSSLRSLSISRCIEDELWDRVAGDPTVLLTPEGPRPRGVVPELIGTDITIPELVFGDAGTAGAKAEEVPAIAGAVQPSIEPPIDSPNIAESSVDVIGVVDEAESEKVSDIFTQWFRV